MSRLVTSICSLPAFGTFGTPVLFGGSSAASSGDVALTNAELDALGERNTTPSGTTIPAVGDPTRFNFMELHASRFDGYAAVYSVARGSNSKSLSMSYWVQTTEVGVIPLGCIFGSPGSGDPVLSMAYQGVASQEAGAGHQTVAGGFTSIGIFNSSTHGAFAGVTPPILSNGWVNVLFSVHSTGGNYRCNLYVNDSVVLDSLGFPVSNYALHADVGSILFATADHISSGKEYYWTIGGADINGTAVRDSSGSTPSPSWLGSIPHGGDGLKTCLAEVWIGEGQYIDFSVAGNRALFHNVDLAQLDWAPCDLGRDGSTPTGTKPTIYCTGTPAKFPINRATGRPCRVFHDSAHAGGLEDILPDCNDAGPS